MFGEKSIFNLKSSLKYSVLVGLLFSISIAGAANVDSLFKRAQFFEKINDKLVLKIALNKKRRAWFSGLWNYSKEFEYPFVFANA